MKFILFLLCVVFISLPAMNAQNMAPTFEAIYQFGDSLNDNGNYIRLPTGTKSAFASFPYGKTINSPTGRASDGLIIVDHIASYFNIPQVNPYLAKDSDFTHGVNFAVIGATANGGLQDHSLAAQLDWFRTHLNTAFNNNPAAIKEKLQKSLVLMGEIGGNDFNGLFFQHKTIEEASKLIPGVIKTISDAVEEVIRLGATNIVVPGNFAIGCVPIYLALSPTNDTSKYDELHCLKDYNEFAKSFNQQLIQAIQQLQQKHTDAAIVYADYYSALTSVISNSKQAGFDQDGTQKACCGSGNNPYNYGDKACGAAAPVCPDPSKRVNWDGIHMTQQGYKNVVDLLIKQFVPALKKLRKSM